MNSPVALAMISFYWAWKSVNAEESKGSLSKQKAFALPPVDRDKEWRTSLSLFGVVHIWVTVEVQHWRWVPCFSLCKPCRGRMSIFLMKDSHLNYSPTWPKATWCVCSMLGMWKAQGSIHNISIWKGQIIGDVKVLSLRSAASLNWQ